ncbi:MAG: arginine deiminase family protein [Planctomycetota bacterium]
MYQVLSAYQPLKKVLMHRPGPEIELITDHTTADHFNYFSAINHKIFRQDYETFLNLVAKNGAEPVLIEEVLAEDAESLAYIRRRPNMIYTRDLGMMVGSGMILMNLKSKGRKFDEQIVGRVCRKLNIPILGLIEPPGLLEGGGLQFFDDHTVLVGLCDRTNDIAIHQLKKILFDSTPVDRLIMIMLPKGVIHIDGDIMMIDEKLAIIYPPHLDIYPSILFTKKEPPRPIWFMDFLRQNNIKLIEISKEECDQAAANYIATGPRQVVGYDLAPRVVEEIKKRGGQVSSFPGDELFKGHGGPHCMTCPLWRA